MKNVLLYLIVIAVFAQAFRHASIYLSFKLNQDYISKYLCVNRELPERGCNGECVLMQKLKKAAKEEQKAPVFQKQQEMIWFFSLPAPLPAVEKRHEAFKAPQWHVQRMHDSQWKEALFRPPIDAA
jgi:hypothetical protein